MRCLSVAVGLAVALGLPSAAPAAAQDRSPTTTEPIQLGLTERERAVRKIYATYFQRTRNASMHERGWAELAPHFADPAVYQLIIDLFADAREPLRGALLEQFVQQATAEADTVLAWIAIFDDSDDFRELAAGRLTERVGDDEPAYGVQAVLAEGIKSPDDEEAVAAAQLIRSFDLLRAVPMLAQAQAVPRNTVDEPRTGALAQIVVGTQQAFVQNLTPVVATGAVGFQPTIGVVSSGTVLRVMDAVVWEYRTEIHRVLVDMTSNAIGSSTSRFGYDANAWIDWYAAELKPKLDAGEL